MFQITSPSSPWQTPDSVHGLQIDVPFFLISFSLIPGKLKERYVSQCKNNHHTIRCIPYENFCCLHSIPCCLFLYHFPREVSDLVSVMVNKWHSIRNLQSPKSYFVFFVFCFVLVTCLDPVIRLVICRQFFQK